MSALVANIEIRIMMRSLYFDCFDTKVGPLTVAVDGEGAVVELWTSDATDRYISKPNNERKPDAVRDVKRQLEEYADGRRTEFDVRVAPDGSDFQHQVWALLRKIPYGETSTYGELAQILGNKNASRAVGRANATNPISIIVPCHRVIGSSGALTGYAGGLAMKQRLLELEGVLSRDLFSDGH